MPRQSAAALAVIAAAPTAYRPPPPTEPPQPPPHLADIERALWAAVFEDFDTPSDVAVAVLIGGLEAHQRAREARLRIEADGGMMIATRDGGSTKPHPLLSVERHARAHWLSCLRALGVEL